MKIRKILIHIILPIIIGGLLYICFRSKTLRLFDWFNLIGADSFIENTRNILYPFKNYLPYWVYGSLPDGLWVYSFSSAYIILWKGNFTKLKFWLLVPVIFGVGVEILQLFKLFRGTFDLKDLIACILGSLLSLILINNKKTKKYENN